MSASHPKATESLRSSETTLSANNGHGRSYSINLGGALLKEGHHTIFKNKSPIVGRILRGARQTAGYCFGADFGAGGGACAWGAFSWGGAAPKGACGAAGAAWPNETESPNNLQRPLTGA
jgi:hypothetical protein